MGFRFLFSSMSQYSVAAGKPDSLFTHFFKKNRFPAFTFFRSAYQTEILLQGNTLYITKREINTKTGETRDRTMVLEPELGAPGKCRRCLGLNTWQPWPSNPNWQAGANPNNTPHTKTFHQDKTSPSAIPTMTFPPPLSASGADASVCFVHPRDLPSSQAYIHPPSSALCTKLLKVRHTIPPGRPIPPNNRPRIHNLVGRPVVSPGGGYFFWYVSPLV